jgi:hypothetical protein
MPQRMIYVVITAGTGGATLSFDVALCAHYES